MASTRLTRTNSGSATLVTKGTISLWFKMTDTLTGGSDRWLIGQYTDSNAHFYIYLRNDQSIGFYQKEGGSTQFSYISTKKFRDTSAWYHLVLAWDTSVSTATDRTKIYINGERITSWATQTNIPQNYGLRIADARAQYIGGVSGYGTHFDGLMSHVYYADGTQYEPTVFGSTDATTGEWKINTSPSFTPGNHGFTILKDGNTITDQSTNSNDWSLQSGTLTNTKDCPSNVFCTLNNLISTVPTAGTNSGTTGTFTNGNLTWTSTNAVWNSRGSGNMFVDTGKFYWETKMNTGGDFNAYIGISPTTTVHEYFDGTMKKAGNFGYYKSGTKMIGTSASSYGDAWVAGDIIGTALDATNSKLYFSKNGVWQNSGDPTSGSTGTGAIPIDANTLYTPRCTIHNMGMSFNFGTGFFGTTAITTNSNNGYAGAEGASKFNYSVPTGYSALNTKGLNQ
tara:strand:+ start:114 stop:1469 length:1356 start_codon:yes stop_codon:yes gene_type:complete